MGNMKSWRTWTSSTRFKTLQSIVVTVIYHTLRGKIAASYTLIILKNRILINLLSDLLINDIVFIVLSQQKYYVKKMVLQYQFQKMLTLWYTPPVI